MNTEHLMFAQKEVRTRLSTKGDLESAYKNMNYISQGIEGLANALMTNSVSMDAFDKYVSDIGKGYENALSRQNEVFTDAATDYFNEVRHDSVAAYAAFLYDLNWFTQELFTLLEDTSLIAYVLKYPNSMVIGAHIAANIPDTALSFHIPKSNQLKNSMFIDQAKWTQKRASHKLYEQAKKINLEFPSPEDFSNKELYDSGGIKITIGRKSSSYIHSVERVNLDGNRFDDSVTEPKIIDKNFDWLNKYATHSIPERPTFTES